MDQRRQLIVDAARTLIVEYGMQYTTKQLACAAGVAEGTLFRIFPSKDEITKEVIISVLNPNPLAELIESLPEDTSLSEHISAVITTIQDHVREAVKVFSLAQGLPQMHDLIHTIHRDNHIRVCAAVESTLIPRAERLRFSPARIAKIVTDLATTSTHFDTITGPPDAREITQIILHGIEKKETPRDQTD